MKKVLLHFFLPFSFCLLTFCGTPQEVPGPTANPLCEPPTTFFEHVTPRQTRHVAVAGNDETGDGSADHPYLTLARAARGIEAGTAIHLHAGRYAGRTFLVDLHGSAEAPIWIMGAPGEAPPTIEGGPEGLHLVQPRFVIVQHLEISGTADNGINVDDGDVTSNPEAARYVVFRDIDVHDSGKNPSGIAACLKLAGVGDVTIADSRFARCGPGPMSGATGVDGVGVHRATVVRNQFTSTGFGAIQFKGGSADVEIRANIVVDAGWRGVNMGGSTGEQFFRPPVNRSAANAEATRIRVVANVFVGGESAAAFTGCVDCEFSRNTVVDPSKWPLRVLQESTSNERLTFVPASRGVVDRNVFYFRRADANAGEDINVGAQTESRSFSMDGNVWYAHDAPSDSRPRLPTFEGVERHSIVGVDPRFVDLRGRDFRLTEPRVREAGSPCPRFPSPQPPSPQPPSPSPLV